VWIHGDAPGASAGNIKSPRVDEHIGQQRAITGRGATEIGREALEAEPERLRRLRRIERRRQELPVLQELARGQVNLTSPEARAAVVEGMEAAVQARPEVAQQGVDPTEQRRVVGVLAAGDNRLCWQLAVVMARKQARPSESRGLPGARCR
jgi:hypothetical protein